MAISGEKLEQLSKDKSVEALKLLLQTISEKHEVKESDLLSILVGKDEDSIPVSAFSSSLSALEVVVTYLKENKGKRYSEIAKLLSRDDRTIWVTYSNAKKKKHFSLNLSSKIKIPIYIFAMRTKSPLESLVLYLKEKGHSFSQISNLLNKDYQTVYTSYSRVMQK